MKNKGYRQGDLFGIPIKPKGYALGIIARCTEKSPTCLGFFFRQKLLSIPSQIHVQAKANEAVFVTWFGDLGLIKGDWPIIGPLRDFKQEEWAVPLFKRIDLLDSTHGWLVEYPQDAPIFGESLRETKVDADSLVGLVDEELLGSQALETVLANILKKRKI